MWPDQQHRVAVEARGLQTDCAGDRNQVFAVIPGSALQSPQHLDGKVVAAGKGTTNLRSLTRYAADRALKVSVIETIDTKAAFKAVSQGTTSAAALNEISAMGWSRDQPQAAVRLLDRYLSTEPVAVGLPKHYPEFVRVFFVPDELLYRTAFALML